jgi:hypothetical protein
VDVGPRGSERLYGGGSFRECVAAIHRREGLRGFYRFYGFDMVFRSVSRRVARVAAAGSTCKRQQRGGVFTASMP